MLDVDEDEKLTGEEEFELLAGPLGLNDRRIVPEPVQFPDSDPLGASVAMVTATNSMEETLMQIGTFKMHFIQRNNDNNNSSNNNNDTTIATSSPLVWFFYGQARNVLTVFSACHHEEVKTGSKLSFYYRKIRERSVRHYELTEGLNFASKTCDHSQTIDASTIICRTE